MVARIEMKLGMYAYYIISMTITCYANGDPLRHVNWEISWEVGANYKGVWMLVVYWNNVNHAQNTSEVSFMTLITFLTL